MSSESKSSSWLTRIGGFVLIAALFFGWRMWNKSDNSAEAAEALKSWVVAMPSYESNKDYLDGLIKKNHEEAFDANYKSGGRRRSAKFDSEAYAGQVFQGMIRQAQADNKPELAASIASTYAEYKQGLAADTPK